MQHTLFTLTVCRVSMTLHYTNLTSSCVQKKVSYIQNKLHTHKTATLIHEVCSTQ